MYFPGNSELLCQFQSQKLIITCNKINLQENHERVHNHVFIVLLQHVHVHVLPRKPDDFKQNDEIYDKVSPK